MLPGLTREAEEQKLQEIIGIAQQNLERARADIRKVNEDLEDLLDVYEAQDKEGLALWNNATARLKEMSMIWCVMRKRAGNRILDELISKIRM